MTTIETIPAEMEVSESWEAKGSSAWLAPGHLDVRRMAKVMAKHQGRLITVTATQLPDDGGLTLDYHWDIDGKLLSFELHVEGNKVESIYDLCEAADWVEREIHEYYAVDFTGREYEPLMLRAGDKAGVNLREEEE